MTDDGCIQIMRSFGMDGPEIGEGEGVATPGLAVLERKSRRWRDGEEATNDNGQVHERRMAEDGITKNCGLR